MIACINFVEMLMKFPLWTHHLRYNVYHLSICFLSFIHEISALRFSPEEYTCELCKIFHIHIHLYFTVILFKIWCCQEAIYGRVERTAIQGTESLYYQLYHLLTDGNEILPSQGLLYMLLHPVEMLISVTFLPLVFKKMSNFLWLGELC